MSADELTVYELIETLEKVTAKRLTFADPDETTTRIALNLLDASADACLWKLMKLAEEGNLTATAYLRRINPPKADSDTAVSDAVN